MDALRAIYAFLLENPTFVGVIVGLITPPLTAVVTQTKWTKPVRTGVSYAVSLVLGFLTAIATGAIGESGADFATTVGAVVALAQVSYTTLWKHTGATLYLEQKTSRNAGPDPVLIDGAH
ncbi:hypothetical protein ACFCZ3_20375 [Cellulosimicrobium cellulans]|uniref:hypothetical protein n=1 Tax=Cellulosimicrobium cellulans TaxID=1710 RepID=UPI0035D5B11D